MKVGIPRALLYNYYGGLWLNFFKNLKIDVIISPPTNKQIIKKGILNSIDEGCYSSKIFIGHVEWLLDKCDCIFVPRIENTGIKEEYCTRLFGVFDLVKQTFPAAKLLHADINYLMRKREATAFLSLGEALGKTSEETEKAYNQAVLDENKRKETLIEEQKKLLEGDSAKVLIVSHAYNTHDAMIGEPIVKYFKENNIDVAFADIIDEKEAMAKAKEIFPRMYWKTSGVLLGGIEKYKGSVDGIVLLSTFPCMPDSIMNELIIRLAKDIPILSLMIDELDATAGLMTRLESFTDIIMTKREKNGK